MAKRYGKGTKQYIKGSYYDGIRKHLLELQIRSLMERKGVTIEQISKDTQIPLEVMNEIMSPKVNVFRKTTNLHITTLIVYFDICRSS